MMSKTLIATAMVLALCSTQASADEYTGNVMLASDYIFRGISQTQEKGAIQGGFDASWDNGLYAGVWGSNVNFGTGGDGASTELDYYGGLSGAAGCEDCSYKAGFIYYRYEGDTKFDYIEAALAFSWKDLTVGLNYSPEYLGDGTTDAVGGKVKFFYPYVNYSYALPSDISLSLHAAYNDMSETGVFEPGQDDYTEWSVGLGKDFGGFSFALTYWDTNVKNLFGADANDADARVVFSISKSL